MQRRCSFDWRTLTSACLSPAWRDGIGSYAHQFRAGVADSAAEFLTADRFDSQPTGIADDSSPSRNGAFADVDGRYYFESRRFMQRSYFRHSSFST